MWRDPRGPFLVPALILLVTRAVWWWAIPHAAEDAYITFRYARNLVDAHQLVFNPGERVMGFSSPLWTLWSALGYMLTHHPVAWARASAVIADLVTLGLASSLLARHASRAAAWAFAVFFAAWPYFAGVSVSGMENGVLVTLVLAAAVLAARGHAATGPALAAVALCRPEGLAMAAWLALGARWRDRLVALALVATGLGLLTLAFGSPVPQSVLAKARLYGTPGPVQGLHWWAWLLPFALPATGATGEGRLLLPGAVILLPAFVAGLPLLWRERATPLARAAAAYLAVWAGYAALGVAYFYWYLVVPLVGLAIAAAVGLPRLLRGRLAWGAAALLVAGSWIPAWPLYVGRSQNEYFGFGQAASFLRHYARPGDAVMLEPIGMVGYEAPVRIVDEVGLVSPAVARRRLEGAGWYADVVGVERPEWLVIRRGVLRSGAGFAGAGAPFRSSAERDTLLARYELATVIDEVAGEAALVVLHRRDAPTQGRSR